MYVERTVNPIESISLRKSLSKGSEFARSFHDIFQRTLNNKSNSCPPKVELTGILIPCYQEIQGRTYRFKLSTESTEYILSMGNGLVQAAKNVCWEEVTVKGYLNLASNIFEIEKIVVAQTEEPLPLPSYLKEPLDVDVYKRIINQRGKLEPATEYLAS